MNNHGVKQHIKQLWLAESIRLTELQSGPLDDSEANRKARALQGDISHKILARARYLAQPDLAQPHLAPQANLFDAQQQWIFAARVALIILLALACIGGLSLGLAALGDTSQPVNIFWALGSLMGLNLLMLSLWLINLIWMPSEAGAFLSRCWLWLTDKFARQGRAFQLAPALLVLLNRNKSTPWVLGALLHGTWLFALSSALLTLLLLLATRQYQFIWETTLLSSDAFISATRLLGTIPAWFGFPLPDAVLIKASGGVALDAESARYAWAGWLVGVFIIYGILPRLLLWLFCYGYWRYLRQRLSLDLSLAENQQLAARLAPHSQPLGVVDADTGETGFSQQRVPVLHANGNLIVAIELDDSHPWPPKIGDHVQDAGIINDRHQRKQLLDQLTITPAARLLIACDPRRSPDRGLCHLLLLLAEKSAATRVYLLGNVAAEASRLAQWRDVLQQLGLQEGDLSWLESHDD